MVLGSPSHLPRAPHPQSSLSPAVHAALDLGRDLGFDARTASPVYPAPGPPGGSGSTSHGAVNGSSHGLFGLTASPPDPGPYAGPFPHTTSPTAAAAFTTLGQSPAAPRAAPGLSPGGGSTGGVPTPASGAALGPAQLQASPPSAGAEQAASAAGSTPTPASSSSSTGPVRRTRARKQRYSRSRTGCLTCRGRKVKCDEQHPVCTRCMDLEIECQWLDPSLLASNSRARTTAEAAAAKDGRDPPPSGSGKGKQPLGPGASTTSPNASASAAVSSSAPIANPFGLGGGGAGVSVSGMMPPAPPAPPLAAPSPSQRPPSARVDGAGSARPGATAPPAPGAAGTAVSPSSSKSSPSDGEADRWSFLAPGSVSLLGGFSLPGIGLVAGSSSAASAAATAAASMSSGFNPVEFLHSLARHPIPGSSSLPHATAGSIVPVDEPTEAEQEQQRQQPHGLAAAPVANGANPAPRISMDGSMLARRRRTTGRNAPGHPPTFNLSFDIQALAQLDHNMLASLTTPLNASLDPLAVAFPSPASRRLFHHFFSLTSSIVIAMSNSPGPNKRKNPILNVSLPLIVRDTDSPAHTAFRLSILSLAAGHLHHQYLDHGDGTNDDARELMLETRRARRHADVQMMLSLTRQGDAELDLVLATCMMLKTRDVVLADKGWKRNLDFALRLILQHGGAVALLNADPTNFARRFVLEQLATSDVFSTFTTGCEPTLLGHGAEWWLENRKSAVTEWQWEAYEHQFGISRGMAEMVAKCRVIAYRKERVLEAVAVTRNGSIRGVGTPSSDTGTSLSTLELDGDMIAITDAIDAEAWALIEQLQVWSMAQQHVPQHARVLLGDSAYRYAMVVMLLHEVLGVPAEDERVQTAVKCVLELCAEISMEPVMLVWPLLLAGARARGDDRTWVHNLFGIFKKDHCTDLMTAQVLLAEQWKRMDDGVGFTPWPQLMREMDLEVLLI